MVRSGLAVRADEAGESRNQPTRIHETRGGPSASVSLRGEIGGKTEEWALQVYEVTGSDGFYNPPHRVKLMVFIFIPREVYLTRHYPTPNTCNAFAA